jgi:hypothetical protein
MSVTDRAAQAAPYLQRVLDDPEVQGALRRATSAGRDTYQRARGRSPGEAIKDRRFQRRARRAALASWQLIAAIDAARTRPRPRRGRRVAFGLAVLAGTYGAYLASNADAREALRGLIAKRDTSAQNSNAQ